MAMTMKVYEVNRDGDVRVVRPEAEIDPLTTPEQSSAYPECQCQRCTTPQLPFLETLTWDQSAGRACVWCRKQLTTGAVCAGTIRARDGAHNLDTEVWACPSCDAERGPRR